MLYQIGVLVKKSTESCRYKICIVQTINNTKNVINGTIKGLGVFDDMDVLLIKKG